MQTSIGPANQPPRKPQYANIAKIARIYVSHTASPDPALERWMQTQRELLNKVAWMEAKAIAKKGLAD